jgi:hypothetical protein
MDLHPPINYTIIVKYIGCRRGSYEKKLIEKRYKQTRLPEAHCSGGLSFNHPSLSEKNFSTNPWE